MTTATIQTLQTRLNANGAPPTALANTHVFLLNEFTWLSIKNSGTQVTVAQQRYGLPTGGPLVFTSRRVLDALIDGTLTWEQALDAELLSVRCKEQCSAENRYGLLGPMSLLPKGAKATSQSA